MKHNRKRERGTIAELIVSAQHYANEVGLPYVIVFEGVDDVFSNSSKRHAHAIMRDALELQDKVQELTVEDKAMKLTAYQKPEEGDTK